MLASATLLADDHVVLFDEDVDFSVFKSFIVGGGQMKSDRAELKFPAVMSALAEAIRTGFAARSLKESSDRSDLMVDFIVTGVDYAIGPFGRANIVSGGRGRRGAPGAGMAVDFTEATLVIDVKDMRTSTLIWRGVFHDTENDARKLADALPRDAATLVAQYPPKKKQRSS